MKSVAIPAKNLTILVNDMNISPRDLETHIGIASTSIRRCVKDGVASAPVEMAATNYLQMLQMRGAQVPAEPAPVPVEVKPAPEPKAADDVTLFMLAVPAAKRDRVAKVLAMFDVELIEL